jgi:polysaccharide deacetylase 2 family uncharacterized protein YibQ
VRRSLATATLIAANQDAFMSDLSTPLGLKTPGTDRRKRPIGAIASVAVVALASAVAVWIIVVDDPHGGEPTATAKIEDVNGSIGRDEVTVVGVKSGTGRLLPREVPVEETLGAPDPVTGVRTPASIATPGPDGSVAALSLPTLPIDGLEEDGPHGRLPRIGEDGVRPLDAYARPVRGLVEAAPRIAVVVGGIGLSQTGTQEAMRQLPPEITLALAPYGSSLDRWTTRARQDGHELLLQLPLEPFDYPDNDPGPQTLLTSAAPDRNLDSLRWVLSRTGTYVGVIGDRGARFTADPAALDPVLREITARGLMYVDDGSSLRSRSAEVAAGKNTPFAQADLVIDTVSTPEEIAGRLAQLEQIARTRGIAVGVASALPVSVRTIGEWAAGLEQRGITLVPVSAAIGRTMAAAPPDPATGGAGAHAPSVEPQETGAHTPAAGTGEAAGDAHGDGGHAAEAEAEAQH